MKSINFMTAGLSDTVGNSILMCLVEDPAFGGGSCERATALLDSSSQFHSRSA